MSQRSLARSTPNVVSPVENSDKLRRGQAMTNENHIRRRANQEINSLEKATQQLWSEKLDQATPGEMDEFEEELVDNEIMENEVSFKESNAGPAGKYMNRSEVEKLMIYNMVATVEVATRCIVTEIVE